ncbi:hypothetical protein SLEP1_g46928 [Rubroshorea leprosula]|uniref:Cytochrome P450 n=1 Tax=Rubroshorea leprosula TaxID=152421 RepID=A0AAV5LQZ8_9ROSI|nr:hypothetical protein SLEP1_g46928 [Rubroshorea leprosula]
MGNGRTSEKSKSNAKGPRRVRRIRGSSGDRHEEFLPERFTNNEVNFKGEHNPYTPFGYGRKACQGMSLAVAEAEYMLANVLYWFDWKLPNEAATEDLDMTEHFAIAVHKKIPLQLVPYSFALTVVSRNPRLSLPPSSSKLPFIGNLHQLGKLPHQSLQTLSEKYGPLMLLHFGTVPTLVDCSAEMAQEIMKKNDLAFANSPALKAAEVKKIAAVELLSQKRVEMFQVVREEEVAKMINEIQISCLNGAAVNLSKMFVKDANNISRDLPLENFMEKNMIFSLDSENLERTFKTLDHFLDQGIEEHQLPKNGPKKSDQKNFIDILLHLQKDDMLSINLTQDNIKAILMGMLIGGTETVAATMEWATSELMKTQESSGKLKKREAHSRTEVGDYEIYPGTRVLINVWAIQRDVKFWERHEEFIPERFSDNEFDFRGGQKQYSPFGCGRRACPGMSLPLWKLSICWPIYCAGLIGGCLMGQPLRIGT